MIDIEEAVKIVLKEDTWPGLGNIAHEYENEYVFGYNNDEIAMSPIGVSKKDGKVFTFFPPYYSTEYLKKSKRINISKYLKAWYKEVADPAAHKQPNKFISDGSDFVLVKQAQKKK